MNDMETVEEDLIQIALAERALALAKERAKWASIRDFYRPVINAMTKAGIEPGFQDGYIRAHFAGDAHKLANIVRILRTAGFDTHAGRPKPGDTEWSAFYTHPNCSTQLWLYFTSSICKRVQVGTKFVEQPVFETRCESGDLSEAVALPAPTAAIEEGIPF